MKKLLLQKKTFHDDFLASEKVGSGKNPIASFFIFPLVNLTYYGQRHEL